MHNGWNSFILLSMSRNLSLHLKMTWLIAHYEFYFNVWNLNHKSKTETIIELKYTYIATLKQAILTNVSVFLHILEIVYNLQEEAWDKGMSLLSNTGVWGATACLLTNVLSEDTRNMSLVKSDKVLGRCLLIAGKEADGAIFQRPKQKQMWKSIYIGQTPTGRVPEIYKSTRSL